jgi:hypothetical protein
VIGTVMLWGYILDALLISLICAKCPSQRPEVLSDDWNRLCSSSFCIFSILFLVFRYFP